MRISAKYVRQNWPRIAAHLAAWGLITWLTWAFFSGNLTVNPIQAVVQRTGKFALIFLVLSLACTPLNTLSGYSPVLKARRTLGLYAFFFATIHYLSVIGLDYGFNLALVLAEIGEKPYIWLGFSALLILTALAATSFRWWMKRLGKNWKRLHRFVYLAAGLVVVHYAWSVKGDLLSLQGDILQPLAFGIVVILLLLVRLPALRRRANNLHYRLARRLERTAPHAG